MYRGVPITKRGNSSSTQIKHSAFSEFRHILTFIKNSLHGQLNFEIDV